MENTLNLLLQDTQSKWYADGNGSPTGPFSSKEVVLRLQSGALSYASHLWRDGLGKWTRIYELSEFKCLLPAEPSAALIQGLQRTQQTIQPTPPSVQQRQEARVWFVYLDNTQFGPFAEAEVTSLIDSGRVKASTYVWKKGFAEWCFAEKVAELESIFKKTTVSTKGDKREAPRKPFEARII